MNNEEKILSLLEQVVTEQQAMRDDIKRIDQTVTRIEKEHGEKITALFDGYVQNTDKLERIHEAVTKQDEFILKRVF